MSGTPIRVSLFGGVAAVPVRLAASRGLFARAGLDVTVTQTASSHDLMSGLANGAYEIVHAAPDNFIEWRDRTGLPVVAWIGGASGWLGLFGSSTRLGSVADLRGGTVAVDAVNSGFVSVLRAFLRGAGLGPDDVTLEPVGATNVRYETLTVGRTDATMLTLPWAAKARDAGLPELARQNVDGVRLPGSCAGSLSGWLSDHSAAADAYLRAVCAATAWLRLPRNRDAAEAAVSELMNIETRYSRDVLATVIDPLIGSPAAGTIDIAAMQNLVDLRTDNGQPPKLAAEAYVDFGPYQRVFTFGLWPDQPTHDAPNPGEMT